MKKEKRYLCDILETKLAWRIFNIFMICSLICIFFYLYYNPHIIYNNGLFKMDWEASYNKDIEQYHYLHEIAELTVNENDGIDIKAIPEDVYFSITKNKDDKSINYYYSTDYYTNTNGSIYNMTITLSEDNEILDTKCSVVLKDKSFYEKINTFHFYLNISIFCFISIPIILIIWVLCYIPSLLHKHYIFKKQNNTN